MRTSIFGGKFKRHLTEFTGGMTHAGIEMAKQPVKIINCVDDVEDIWRVESFTGTRHTVDGYDLSPHPETAELNTEFVERVMEGRSALTQVMIIQAIEQFAKGVLQAPAKTAEEDNGFVTDAAWRAEAHYILGQFAARDLIEQNRRAKVTA